MKADFSIIGKPVIRSDAQAKVTGQAKFADDYNLPGQLIGVMLRIPAVHARITGIDYSVIENDASLEAICDARDITGVKQVGPIRADQPIFAYDKVVTSGDVLAMLLGEDEAALYALRDKIRVSFDPLPVLTDPRQSLQEGAPIIHPQFGNNLIIHYPLRKGDIEQGFRESDEILEQTYSTPFIEHAYIEPEALIAIPRRDRQEIHLIGSFQNPHTARKVVASVMGWPLNRVRIEQAELGGSFGGKDDTMNIIAARAAIGAWKTNRPVKIRYSREDSIRESYKRHPYIMQYKVGYKKNGQLMAMKIDILADGGAYSSMTPFVNWRTVVQATGPYQIEHVWTDVRGVYTNNPYAGAMRGFGSPQPIFAQESIMDEIALRLGLTPVQIRVLNGFGPGSVTASGQQLKDHDVNLLEALQAAVNRTDFETRWQHFKNSETPAFLKRERSHSPATLQVKPEALMTPDQCWRQGIGLALSYRGCSLGAEGIDAAAAYLSLQPDGSAYLISGLAENGQGLRTTFSIIAAEALGVAPEDIHYLEQSTALVPDSGPTVASRSTLMGGGAVKAAAEIIRNRLEKLIQEQWKLQSDDRFVFKNHIVYCEAAPERQINFSALCQLAYNSGISLAAIGWYKGPRVRWEESTGQGDAYFTYVYGCQVAEVRVNCATGETLVDRITAVHDPGTVINRLGALGQVYGGVTQGAGYGLWEEISVHNGSIRELNFDQFLIPTSKDIGEIAPVFLEGRDVYGPWGAKSLGEPTLELTAAAIANAVCNATGQRYFNLPLNLEEIILRRKLYPEDLKRGSAV
jgi:CO/xanthine dehydrogenase Mo-binding subunit